MNARTAWTSGLLACSLIGGCRSHEAKEVPIPSSRNAANAAEGAATGATLEDSPLSEVDQEILALQKELVDIYGQIEKLHEKLAKPNLSEADKATLEQELSQIESRKLSLSTQLQKLLSTQLEMQPAAPPPAAETPPPGGYPACGATTYGTVFACGDKQCSKSDPEYKNICMLASPPAPASPPANPPAAGLGASGYPYCGTPYYGDVFACKERQCAKSDPAFINICEIK